MQFQVPAIISENDYDELNMTCVCLCVKPKLKLNWLGVFWPNREISVPLDLKESPVPRESL